MDKYDVSRRLNKILSTGKFVMFYQLQVHLTKHEHAAFESLIRYIDDEGNIQPPIFIRDFLQLECNSTSR